MKNLDENVYFKILKLFGKQGTRFTTEDLARELGTSKRTIYKYFENKEDIIDKTIDFVFKDIKCSDTAILENKDLSLQEKVEQFFKNIPDSYNIGVLIRHSDDLSKSYPHLWKKIDDNMNFVWDDLLFLVDNEDKHSKVNSVNTTVLKIMLDQTLQKLLDYDFIAENQLSFEAGIKEMCNIILYGLIDDKK